MRRVHHAYLRGDTQPGFTVHCPLRCSAARSRIRASARGWGQHAKVVSPPVLGDYLQLNTMRLSQALRLSAALASLSVLCIGAPLASLESRGAPDTPHVLQRKPALASGAVGLELRRGDVHHRQVLQRKPGLDLSGVPICISRSTTLCIDRWET